MAKIVKSTIIMAPAEEIFEYVETPANVPEYWPSLLEVKDVEQLSGGGYRYDWVYKMAGVRFEGKSVTTEFIPNQRTVSESEGGVSSTVCWTYEAVEGGTKVTIEGDYTVNLPVLRKLAESFLAKLNENEAETILANVKARLEA